MAVSGLNDQEIAFTEQSSIFVSKALEGMGLSCLDEVSDITTRDPYPLTPIFIEDIDKLQEAEKQALSQTFNLTGIAHFAAQNPPAHLGPTHPLLRLAEQLADVMPLRYPVTHPMEGHPEAVARFGEPDGTLKIYDLESARQSRGYREVAETTERFEAHNDGLGYGGAVEVFCLYADTAPLWGGYTYFQDAVHLSLILARKDPEAFRSLFLPNAITAIRPRGKGAIKVVTPVLFLNEHHRPHVFFRISSGEYKMSWREWPALQRATAFLHRHMSPFSPGSCFVHLNRRGMGCFAQNERLIHGRTNFIDGQNLVDHRVLARKWFMSAEKHASYKHVPGMHIAAEFAAIYPERFGPDQLEGDWQYDAISDKNVRQS